MEELLDLLKHNECQHVYQMNGEDHRDALNKIDRGNEFFSVILIQETIDESLMENPKYVRKIPITHISRIEQEAQNKWNEMDQASRESARKTIQALRKKRNELSEWYGD